jgi:hypothetical protein
MPVKRKSTKRTKRSKIYKRKTLRRKTRRVRIMRGGNTEKQVQAKINRVETEINRLEEATSFIYPHQETEINEYPAHDKTKMKLLADKKKLAELKEKLNMLNYELQEIREKNNPYGASLASYQY